jgi:hypothetical protein
MTGDFCTSQDERLGDRTDRQTPKKTSTPEQIVGKVRQIEVLVSQGKRVPLRHRSC